MDGDRRRDRLRVTVPIAKNNQRKDCRTLFRDLRTRHTGTLTGEQAIQVVIRDPRAGRPADHTKHNVEDGVGQCVVDTSKGKPIIEQDLNALPTGRTHKSNDAARDQRVTRRIEELVVAPKPVDDFGRDRDQRKGSDDVGDLVVKRYGLKDVPKKARRVE
jgi:hypothetical protein